MSEITDELLDVLDDLEETTSQLDEQVDALETATKSQKTPDEINTASAMLQATQLTHEATLQSQEAAEINLKLSKEQEILMENFEENNLNLRHTLSQARQDFSSSKGFFIGILVIVLLIGLVLGGLMAWFTYKTTNQQNAFKDEIIDIIHTQAHLSHRAIETSINQALYPSDDKTDQAALVDLLQEDSVTSSATQEEQAVEMAQADTSTEKVDSIDVAQPLNAELEELKKSQAAALEQLQQHITQLAKQPAVTSNNQADIKRINQQLANMNQLIKNQNQQLNQLLAKLNKINKAPAKTPLPAAAKDSTADITAKLNQISKEIENLKAQQIETQEALNKLAKEAAKPAKTTIDTDAYSYRNPYEYKDTLEDSKSESNQD